MILRTCFFALAVTASASCLQADVVQLDFGRSTNVTATYNNIGAVGVTAGLVNTSAAATPWSLELANTGVISGAPGGGAGQAGGGADVTVVPAAVSTFATTATLDNFFFNSQAGAGNIAEGTVTLTGLSAGETYDLLFYGSRLNGQGLPAQVWSMTTGIGGNSASTFSHPSLDNQTVVANWIGISPVAGTIQFKLTGATDAGAGAIALNFGQVTSSAIPEPTSIAVLGLGMIGLVFRRRR